MQSAFSAILLSVFTRVQPVAQCVGRFPAKHVLCIQAPYVRTAALDCRKLIEKKHQIAELKDKDGTPGSVICFKCRHDGCGLLFVGLFLVIMSLG